MANNGKNHKPKKNGDITIADNNSSNIVVNKGTLSGLFAKYNITISDELLTKLVKSIDAINDKILQNQNNQTAELKAEFFKITGEIATNAYIAKIEQKQNITDLTAFLQDAISENQHTIIEKVKELFISIESINKNTEQITIDVQNIKSNISGLSQKISTALDELKGIGEEIQNTSKETNEAVKLNTKALEGIEEDGVKIKIETLQDLKKITQDVAKNTVAEVLAQQKEEKEQTIQFLTKEQKTDIKTRLDTAKTKHANYDFDGAAFEIVEAMKIIDKNKDNEYDEVKWESFLIKSRVQIVDNNEVLPYDIRHDMTEAGTVWETISQVSKLQYQAIYDKIIKLRKSINESRFTTSAKVFLSCAITDDGTPESLVAEMLRSIYGEHIFYSEHDIESDENYKAAIYVALEKVDTIVVLYSSLQNINRPFVQSEWRSFMLKHNIGVDNHKKVILCSVSYKSFEKPPAALSGNGRQAIKRNSDRQWLKKLRERIENVSPEAKLHNKADVDKLIQVANEDAEAKVTAAEQEKETAVKKANDAEKAKEVAEADAKEKANEVTAAKAKANDAEKVKEMAITAAEAKVNDAEQAKEAAVKKAVAEAEKNAEQVKKDAIKEAIKKEREEAAEKAKEEAKRKAVATVKQPQDTGNYFVDNVAEGVKRPQEKKSFDESCDGLKKTEQTDNHGNEIYTFGRYPTTQYGDEKPSPLITWIKLKENNGAGLFVSEKILDCHKYDNAKHYKNRLKQFTDNYEIFKYTALGKWLNGEFKNTAFENTPQNSINSEPNINKTGSMVFLLSAEEETLLNNQSVIGTPYAEYHGDINRYWRLSPNCTVTDTIGVRPAIWINLTDSTAAGGETKNAPSAATAAPVASAATATPEASGEIAKPEYIGEDCYGFRRPVYKFGTYKNEPIRWILLNGAKAGEKGYFVSERVLDVMRMHSDSENYKKLKGTYGEGVFYHTDLGIWLNGGVIENGIIVKPATSYAPYGAKTRRDYFLDAAFDEAERAAVLTANGQGIGLLSVEDVEDNKLLSGKKRTDWPPERRSMATPYLESNRSTKDGSYLYIYSNDDKDGYLEVNGEKKGCSWYWLRTPGESEGCAADVSSSGGVYSGGSDVDFVDAGVRPALCLNL
jgi:chemotaxis protein histidine kinase CheA